MSHDDRRIPVDVGVLKAFCRQVFSKLGVSEEDARIAADVVTTANLRGIDSHGVSRLRRFYVNPLRKGTVVPRPQIRVVAETPVTAVMDGGGGLGQPTGYRAMKLAIEKAGRYGAGFVTVCNSSHFGIAGYYATMALEHGCIGLSMTNGHRWVVPTFGRDRIYGTNPIAVAVPADQEPPFVLDMATSTAPLGKVEVYDLAGKPLPLGWATDPNGQPMSDPAAFMRNTQVSMSGGLLPLGGAGEEMGGHKGYGLAIWVDIFSAVLSGAEYADRVGDFGPEGEPHRANLGHFFGAWRVDAFRPPQEFHADMDDLMRRLKGSRKAEGQERIYVAGEKEAEQTERRLREGIPLPAPVMADLQALASELEVEPPAVRVA